MDELMSTRMMLALENLGSAAITDAEGRYIYVTRRRLANGNFKPEDLLGKRVRDVYPDTLVDQVIHTRIPVTMHPRWTKDAAPPSA